MLPGHVSHSAFSGFISIYRYEQRSKKSLKGGGMRKKLLFLFTIVLIITMGFISGCGGCSCTSEEEEARHQEFMEDFESLQEDSSILPTEAELGVPVYGENVDPSSVESSMSETDGEVTDVGVDYSTSDDFETVVSWYKGELGPPGDFQQLPDGQTQAWWDLEQNGMSISLIVTDTGEGTAISILSKRI
jgi:hypothetical protein